jgi:cation diffusion facilitator CzcD-associated flavoprotein CzcO
MRDHSKEKSENLFFTNFFPRHKTMDTSTTLKALAATYAGYAIYSKVTKTDTVVHPPIRKDSPKVVVIGAGFSGICMSIKLAEKGIEHIVLEKEADVGGTWWVSNYPGVQCDIPSHQYCYSFEMNSEWSQAYAQSKEICAYIHHVARKYHVYDKCRLNTKVKNSTWNEAESKWVVTFQTKGKEEETLSVDYLISGIGGLHIPSFPNVKGRETFKGPSMHSAEWDPNTVYKGKNVVVIGSAASAVQIVPSICEDAKTVTCLQRTPNWLAPQRSPFLPPSLKYGPVIRWIFRNVPGTLLLHRWSLYWSLEMVHFPLGLFNGASTLGQKIAKFVLTRYMRFLLKGNKELEDKVIPKYSVGCKRIIRSERFIPALLRDNVELVTDKLAEVVEDGVVVDTAKGLRKIEADLIVYATGYDVGSVGDMKITGVNGAYLHQKSALNRGIETYYGVCNSHFPNGFLLLGPNTGLGHNSIIIMSEVQTAFIAGVIELACNEKVSRLTVKESAVQECMNMIYSQMDESVWKKGGCVSWYQNADGKVPTVWPGTTLRYMIDLVPPTDLSIFDCIKKGN